jgi:hypothetical protein
VAKSSEAVVDGVLALRGFGTTDVAGALTAAADQLGRSRAGRKITILLSDCRATERGDVVAAARRLDELIVVAPASDSEEAANLARSAGASMVTVEGPSDVARALSVALIWTTTAAPWTIFWAWRVSCLAGGSRASANFYKCKTPAPLRAGVFLSNNIIFYLSKFWPVVIFLRTRRNQFRLCSRKRSVKVLARAISRANPTKTNKTLGIRPLLARGSTPRTDIARPNPKKSSR